MSQPRLLVKRTVEAAPPEAPPPHVALDHAEQAAKKGAPLHLVSKDWQLQADAVSELLSDIETDYFVVGILGGPGLGKSMFLNALLGAGQGEGADCCAPFRVGGLEHRLSGQHCSSGIQIQVSSDGIVALDSQPLFSLSLLSEVARWERPSIALAGPAVAAAAAAKSNVAPFEAAQRLMELQAGVLLLSVCHLVVVVCDGLDDSATWSYLQTVEMLAQGVPDPTLPHLPTPPQAGAAGGGKAPTAQQAQQQQFLADVLLLHVVDPPGTARASGSGLPGMEDLRELERRARTYFAPSRLNQPGPISLLDFLQRRQLPPQKQAAAAGVGGDRPQSAGHNTAAVRSGANGSRLSWWVTPRPMGPESPPGGGEGGKGEEGEAWRAVLLRRLLRYPRREFARGASQKAWGAGAARAWEAVAKSLNILDFYSRTVRTVHKGAGGWGLAR